MKRAALIAGVSFAAFVCVGPTQVLAVSNSNEFWSGRPRSFSPYAPAWSRSSRRVKGPERRPSKADRAADKAPPSPSGPLHVIVSIDKQRATLFDNGVAVASTAISTGTPDHPTPMGLFTVIQKSRHHVSNLYDAPMPFMQRITWSGSALHEGPLPGYPASHGCVRLTGNFAQLLWKTTKMGARVIITRPEVVPVEIEHARLFVPQPKVASAPTTTSALVKTAEAVNATPVAFARDSAQSEAKSSATDGAGRVPEPTAARTADTIEAKAAATSVVPAPIIVDERPKTMPAATVQEANRRPISVFVSLEERKLYVRQGWKPLFETPVTFEHPERPVGTHVYTAMGMKAGGNSLRWTVVSIPSSTKRGAEPKATNSRKPRNERAVKAAAVVVPMPSASAALDRIVMPADAVERISELMMPGSSLIVSDNKLSDETGEYTDFIVLTR
jgi:hypothetical protein